MQLKKICGKDLVEILDAGATESDKGYFVAEDKDFALFKLFTYQGVSHGYFMYAKGDIQAITKNTDELVALEQIIKKVKKLKLKANKALPKFEFNPKDKKILLQSLKQVQANNLNCIFYVEQGDTDSEVINFYIRAKIKAMDNNKIFLQKIIIDEADAEYKLDFIEIKQITALHIQGDLQYKD